MQLAETSVNYKYIIRVCLMSYSGGGGCCVCSFWAQTPPLLRAAHSSSVAVFMSHLIFHMQKGVLLNDNLKLNCINFLLIVYLILNELNGNSLPCCMLNQSQQLIKVQTQCGRSHRLVTCLSLTPVQVLNTFCTQGTGPGLLLCRGGYSVVSIPSRLLA